MSTIPLRKSPFDWRTLNSSDDFVSTPSATCKKYSGYIFPGLIDTHNHPQYNAIPRWRAAKKYKNRYEWIVDPIYRQNVEAVFAKLKEHHVEYAALKYGEVRALIGGTT